MLALQQRREAVQKGKKKKRNFQSRLRLAKEVWTDNGIYLKLAFCYLLHNNNCKTIYICRKYILHFTTESLISLIIFKQF